MPKISVIVPVYQAENYLRKCVESILNQSFADFELILVDDGSPDKSPIMCDEYRQQDSRVRVIHQENGGVSAARNTGIYNAAGDYLVFIDSDDYVSSFYLEELYKGCTKGADIAICGYYAVASPKCTLTTCIAYSLPHGYSGTVKEIFKHIIGSQLLYSPWNKLFKTKVLRDNHIVFDKTMNLGEDLCFNIAYLYFCERCYICNLPLYFYVKQNSTLSKNVSINYFDVQKRIYKTIKEFIKKKDINYDLDDRIERMLNDIVGTLVNSHLQNKEMINQKLQEILEDNLTRKYIIDAKQKRTKSILYYVLKSRSIYLILLYFKVKNRVNRLLQRRDSL